MKTQQETEKACASLTLALQLPQTQKKKKKLYSQIKRGGKQLQCTGITIYWG